MSDQTKIHCPEHEVRLDKVKKLRQNALEPWPQPELSVSSCAQVHNDFATGSENKSYTLAGRIKTIRLHGKSAFATMQDASSTLQIYLKADVLPPREFQNFEQFIDLGDIISVTGTSFKTKTGEVTLKVESYMLLSKSLYPLPEKFHGLSDIETRYRQRYLDLITNQESKERFIKRSLIVRTIRSYLDSHGYLEVETPMLHPIAGGAAARPFVTHHNALDQELFMRIAPELYLKRLIVGGFDKVYELNRNFRNEGISTRHNPEFTMVEFYTAYQNYEYIMDFTEHLLRSCARTVGNTMQLQFGTHTIDFEKPFARIKLKDSVKNHLHLTDAHLEGSQLNSLLAKHGIKLDYQNPSQGHKLLALFETFVEPTLTNPTFIIDFPIEVSPLAKRDPKNSAIAARFELFIAGMEIANGFNELNDPLDQAERFKEQLTLHHDEAHQYDADFILALEHGMPPTVGVGIGIDRLVMLMTNTTSIKDVILFPTLRKK